ncbi:MAG: hypothetical protein AAF799_34180 [Myxococcota bacterium]
MNVAGCDAPEEREFSEVEDDRQVGQELASVALTGIADSALGTASEAIAATAGSFGGGIVSSIGGGLLGMLFNAIFPPPPAETPIVDLSGEAMQQIADVVSETNTVLYFEKYNYDLESLRELMASYERPECLNGCSEGQWIDARAENRDLHTLAVKTWNSLTGNGEHHVKQRLTAVPSALMAASMHMVILSEFVALDRKLGRSTKHAKRDLCDKAKQAHDTLHTLEEQFEDYFNDSHPEVEIRFETLDSPINNRGRRFPGEYKRKACFDTPEGPNCTDGGTAKGMSPPSSESRWSGPSKTELLAAANAKRQEEWKEHHDTIFGGEAFESAMDKLDDLGQCPCFGDVLEARTFNDPNSEGEYRIVGERNGAPLYYQGDHKEELGFEWYIYKRDDDEGRWAFENQWGHVETALRPADSPWESEFLYQGTSIQCIE